MLHFNDHPFHHSQMYELVVSAEVIVQVLLYNAAGCKGIQHESVKEKAQSLYFHLIWQKGTYTSSLSKQKKKRIEMI